MKRGGGSRGVKTRWEEEPVDVGGALKRGLTTTLAQIFSTVNPLKKKIDCGNFNNLRQEEGRSSTNLDAIGQCLTLPSLGSISLDRLTVKSRGGSH